MHSARAATIDAKSIDPPSRNKCSPQDDKAEKNSASSASSAVKDVLLPSLGLPG